MKEVLVSGSELSGCVCVVTVDREGVLMKS